MINWTLDDIKHGLQVVVKTESMNLHLVVCEYTMSGKDFDKRFCLIMLPTYEILSNVLRTKEDILETLIEGDAERVG